MKHLRKTSRKSERSDRERAPRSRSTRNSGFEDREERGSSREKRTGRSSGGRTEDRPATGRGKSFAEKRDGRTGSRSSERSRPADRERPERGRTGMRSERNEERPYRERTSERSGDRNWDNRDSRGGRGSRDASENRGTRTGGEDRDKDFKSSKRFSPERDGRKSDRARSSEKPFSDRPGRYTERNEASGRGERSGSYSRSSAEKPSRSGRGERPARREESSRDEGRGTRVPRGRDERPFREERSSGREERGFERRERNTFPVNREDNFREKRAGNREEPSYRDDRRGGEERGRSSGERRKPYSRFSEGPARRPRVRYEEGELPPITKEYRLNRFISMAGICSRREADGLIEAGVISVNGEVVTELGTKVKPGDDIRYNGERIRNEKPVYLLLNKPKDYITTAEDPEGRKTVMELVGNACEERIYPVGRLDRNTTGLLMFTNDGDLARFLTHPSSKVKKIYAVELDKNFKVADMQKVREGLILEDGKIEVDDIDFDEDGQDKKKVGIEIHSGKNRIVRRIFEHLGYEVKKLDRVIFAGLTKKDLPRGRWRFLTEAEVNLLKVSTGAGKKRAKKPVKAGRE